MPGIVALPQVVQEAMHEFADLFACEPQRRHFGEDLTGLMSAGSPPSVLKAVSSERHF